MPQDVDVVVVGSGAGGMAAALRASHHGLDVLMIEKAHQYGGTSATSGGVLWIPNHGLGGEADDDEDAMLYLRSIMRGAVREDRVRAYVDNGRKAAAFLNEEGLRLRYYPGWPDYFSDAPGARATRSLLPEVVDGAALGEELLLIRSQPSAFRLLNRYTLDLEQAFALAAQPRGWQWIALKIVAKYWLDWPWRFKTKRDRRMTMGNALIGGMRLAMMKRGIALRLNTRLVDLVQEGGRVAGVIIERNGRQHRIGAHKGVIIAAGGFEQNQAMRDANLPVPGNVKWSHTPAGANTGDSTIAGRKVGAATEFMDKFWWAPSMQLPATDTPNHDVTHQMFFDYHHPHSVCVNQNGHRFVNECTSYDEFGIAMVEDAKQTGGANAPCWMIFDATYRKKYTCGGLMPSTLQPDKNVPSNWWDNYIFRADSVAELARKIEIDSGAAEATVANMNGYAKTGKDPQFARGETEYERFAGGDSRVSPNSCIGPIDTPPYYAMRVDLGDIGTKGGLKADALARVLDEADRPIPGLYAVGNAAGCPFGDAYPGGGGTIGPSVTFGFIAANHIAEQAELGAFTQNQQAARA